MKIRLPKSLAVALFGAFTAMANAGTMVVPGVVDVVNEDKTTDALPEYMYSTPTGANGNFVTVSPGVTYTKPYVKEGEGTLTIENVGTESASKVKIPLYVRNGKVVIQNSNIIAAPTVDGGGSHISVGGHDAELVLDGTTYLNRSIEAGDGTADNGNYINVGGPDGGGTLTLKNNSALSARYSMFVGYRQDDYWYDTVYAMNSTTVSPDSTERYSGGTYSPSMGDTAPFGAGVVNIESGSKVHLGSAFFMGEGTLNLIGKGSELNSGVITPQLFDFLGRKSGGYSVMNIEDGGKYTTRGYLVTGASKGIKDAKADINVKGEGSVIDARGIYLGYYAEADCDTTLNVTEGALIKASGIGLGEADGKSVIQVNVDKDSTVEAGSLSLSTNSTYNNAGTLTGGYLTVNDGVFANTGSITLSETLTMNGGTLVLNISSANLSKADVTVGAFNGAAGTIELRATENLKAGKYHIIDVAASEESGEAPVSVASSQGGVQYTLIGVDGMETTWEGGDLFLTLNEQLIVSRDPLSDALMAANWGVFHSSQAFTGTLWAPRAAASCTQVDSDKVAWATAYSSFISQNDADKFKGADYSIYGASMGVETPLGKNRIIGVAFGYDMGKASLPNTSDIDQTSCHIAAYGRAAVWCFGEQGNLALDWSAAYGSTTSEHDAVPGDWTQDSFQLDARATYSRSLSSRTSVSAFFGAQYYSQESASTARAQADSIKNFRLMLGTGIQRSVTDKTAVFGEAMLRQDVMRDNPNVMVDGFHYGTGANPGRFGGSISAGVEHQLNDDWKVRANYSFEVADDQNVHSFGAGASYSF